MGAHVSMEDMEMSQSNSHRRDTYKIRTKEMGVSRTHRVA